MKDPDLQWHEQFVLTSGEQEKDRVGIRERIIHVHVHVELQRKGTLMRMHLQRQSCQYIYIEATLLYRYTRALNVADVARAVRQ